MRDFKEQARILLPPASTRTADGRSPGGRSTPGTGGDGVVGSRLEEERQGKRLLAELERLGVEHPEFDALLHRLAGDVRSHAEKEENEEHPRLEQAVGGERLRELTPLSRAAERMAPTHPHPRGSESATANLLAGPVRAIVDRTRDAIRKAMDTSGS